MIETVLSLFLTRVAGGYAICLALIGPRVTEGSWRKVSLFVIAALSIVAYFAGAPALPTLCTAGFALLLERGIAFGLKAANPAWMLPFGAYVLMANEPDWHSFHAVASGLAAGGTLGAMLLGHSYLTARGLSFQPFKRMTLLLLGVLICRVFTVAPAWFFYDHIQMMDWVFLSMRTAAGLLLPLVLTWMVWQCVKIESNQSATGILYASTVLVGVFGEMIAIYLQVNAGILA